MMISIHASQKILIGAFFLLVSLLILPLGAAYSAPAESAYGNGINLVKEGDYSNAVLAFDQAVTLDPGFYEAWNGKADALNRNGQYPLALIASDRALSINASYCKAWINRGYILYNLGRYEDELKAYETAIAIDPRNADGWFNRGYALAAMERYDEAINSFEMVAAIDPAYPNLEANIRIAKDNREKATPFYIRYAPGILIGAVITSYAVLVLVNNLKKKR